MRRSNLKFFIIMIAVFLSATITAEEQKAQIEYYKYPIRVDGREKDVTSGELAIGIQAKPGTPVAIKDLQDNNDEMVKIFKDYFKAFEKKSFEGFPYQIEPPMPAIEEDKSMPDNMKNWIYLNYEDLAGKSFLIKNIIGEKSEVFAFGKITEDKKSCFLQIISIVKNGEKIVIERDYKAADKDRSILMLHHLFKNQLALQKIDPKTQYEYSFYLGTKKLIKCCFNGTKYNLNVLTDNNKKTDRIADFYIESEKAEQSLDEYASFFTEFSKKTILELHKSNPQMWDFEKRHRKESPKTILFILNAAPMYVVFYRTQKTNEIVFDGCDYVIDAKDGLKRTHSYLFAESLKDVQKVVYPKGK